MKDGHNLVNLASKLELLEREVATLRAVVAKKKKPTWWKRFAPPPQILQWFRQWP